MIETVLAAGLLALAAEPMPPAAATAPPPAVITQPDWIEKPNIELLSAAFPPLALRLGLTGNTVVSCRVDAQGRLQDCRIVAEGPAGMGFGAATLSLSHAFHMRPQTRNGEAVEGGTVRIPLRFQAYQEPEIQMPAAPSSRRALELARELLEVIDDGPADDG